ncbi:MAG: hypothetical protein GEV11_23180 [Streptosporangiales bacterium]|nr:hypothetical protein [Streptosporangiales bacterium]
MPDREGFVLDSFRLAGRSPVEVAALLLDRYPIVLICVALTFAAFLGAAALGTYVRRLGLWQLTLLFVPLWSLAVAFHYLVIGHALIPCTGCVP